MASINGLTIKNTVTWLGREGYATQGDLYLDEEKIGFWSQDGDGGEAWYEFEEKYSLEKFFSAINYLNKDKIYVYESNGIKHKMRFDVDLLMDELLDLQELEKEYQKIFYSSNKTMVVISNFSLRKIIQLPTYAPDIDSELIKLSIKKQIDKFREEHGSENLEVKIFRSFDDFKIGDTLKKEDIYNFQKLSRTIRWQMVIFKDKTITKEEFSKLDKSLQDEILKSDVICSNKNGCYYEKEYFLNFTKEEQRKDEIELEERDL